MAKTTVHFFKPDQFLGFSGSLIVKSTRYLFSFSMGIVADESFLSVDNLVDVIVPIVDGCRCSGRSCTIITLGAGLVQIQEEGIKFGDKVLTDLRYEYLDIHSTSLHSWPEEN